MRSASMGFNLWHHKQFLGGSQWLIRHHHRSLKSIPHRANRTQAGILCHINFPDCRISRISGRSGNKVVNRLLLFSNQ
jgi:hypothetical protein